MRYLTALAALALLLAVTGTAGATTWNVNPGQSIQNAIDGASPGDTINVAAGTYSETLTIPKSLTLQGAGRSLSTVNGSGGNRAVDITGSNVTFRDFSVVGPAGQNEKFGMHLNGADNCVIEDNDLFGGTPLGVMWDSDNNTIRNNEIHSDTTSGQIYGIWLYMESDNNQFIGNYIHTAAAGVLLATTPSGNVINGAGTITNCYEGIAAYNDLEVHDTNFTGFDPSSGTYAVGAYPGICTVDARNNWWGTTVESEIQAQIECGDVLYAPWLTSEAQSQPVVPEPVTLGGLMLGLTALVGYVRRRRR